MNKIKIRLDRDKDKELEIGITQGEEGEKRRIIYPTKRGGEIKINESNEGRPVEISFSSRDKDIILTLENEPIGIHLSEVIDIMKQLPNRKIGR